MINLEINKTVLRNRMDIQSSIISADIISDNIFEIGILIIVNKFNFKVINLVIINIIEIIIINIDVKLI